MAKGEKKEEIICDKAGQNITLSFMEGEFLHSGSIICPACLEVCGEDNCAFDNFKGGEDVNSEKLVRKEKVRFERTPHSLSTVRRSLPRNTYLAE